MKEKIGCVESKVTRVIFYDEDLLKNCEYEFYDVARITVDDVKKLIQLSGQITFFYFAIFEVIYETCAILISMKNFVFFNS